MSKITQFFVGMGIGAIGTPLKFLFLDKEFSRDPLRYGVLSDLIIVAIILFLARKRWPLLGWGLLAGSVIGIAFTFWAFIAASSGIQLSS